MISFSNDRPLRVAVLIDLPRTPLSGGHVKGWEQRARALANTSLPLDLTIYFSGKESRISLNPKVTYRALPPIFSTSRLTFLPYMPDETDLASFHPLLAKELGSFDVIHTTDAFFNFAQTAMRICREHAIPLATSLHTDTPNYTRVFTKETINKLVPTSFLKNFFNNVLAIPEKQGQKKDAQLEEHVAAASAAITAHPEDFNLCLRLLGKDRVYKLPPCTDKNMFGAHRANRKVLESDYHIPSGQTICLFVGRVDVGKNIYTLVNGIEKLVQEGLPIHLIIVGVGPEQEAIKEKLGDHVTLAGFVDPEKLGSLYASIDLVTFPSEIETQSLTTIEGLATGKPVLLSGLGCVPKIFDYNKGLVVIHGGADAWAEALRDLVLNPTKVDSIGQEALKYGQENIKSWEEEMSNLFFPIWERLAKEKYNE